MADLERTTTDGADKIRACTRKKTYDERTAKFVAGRVRERTGEDVVHYGCTYCGSWHIGHRRRS